MKKGFAFLELLVTAALLTLIGSAVYVFVIAPPRVPSAPVVSSEFPRVQPPQQVPPEVQIQDQATQTEAMPPPLPPPPPPTPPPTVKSPTLPTTLPSPLPPPPPPVKPPSVPPVTPPPTPTPIPKSITQDGFLLSGTSCIIDYTLVPQSEVNARRLLNLCEIDAPKLEAKFGRGPSAPPYKIQFYTPAPGSQGTGGDARAYAGSSGVFLSTDSWRTEFPYDAKILAHEITHFIQSFYGYNTPEYPGWLVEALADYGAYVAGYSNDLEKDCYHFSNPRQIHVFNCTYKFLKFVEKKYDPQVSFKLHKALQSGIYSDSLFSQYTGKTYDQLISECSQDLDCGGVDPL